MTSSLTPGLVRDLMFYCADHLLIQVENVLFRVHRAIFDQSEVFQDMFRVPPPGSGDAIVDGADDEHPLILHGYTAEDFRQLLKVTMPLKYHRDVLTSDEWTPVLKLATAWEMADARADAIHHLAQLVPEATDPILRIILSTRFGVFEWFVPAVHVLARRVSPVGLADVQRLSVLGDPMELALKLSWVRESFTGQQSVRSLVGPGPVTAPQVQKRQRSSGFFLNTFAPGDCGYYFLCTQHGVVTKCVGEGYAGDVNGERRAAHDFTAAICKIFECAPDGRPKHSQ